MTRDVQILPVLDKVKAVAHDGYELIRMTTAADVPLNALDEALTGFEARLAGARTELEPFVGTGNTLKIRVDIVRLAETLELAEKICGEVKSFVAMMKES